MKKTPPEKEARGGIAGGQFLQK